MKRGKRKKRFAICFLVFLCRWNHRYLTQIRTWASSRGKTAFGWSTKYNANPLQFYLTLYPPLLSVLCFLHATCLFVSLCMCLWVCLCVCACVCVRYPNDCSDCHVCACRVPERRVCIYCDSSTRRVHNNTDSLIHMLTYKNKSLAFISHLPPHWIVYQHEKSVKNLHGD